MAAFKPYYPKKRKGGGSINKRANGNYRAARAQADNGQFIVKGTQMINAFYDPSYNATMDLQVPMVGSTFVNFYEVLRQNKNFQLQKQLWDEFRINKIKVNLTVANAVLDINNYNKIKTINVVTAWDRTGLSCRQITPLKNVNFDAADAGHATNDDIINVGTEKRTAQVKGFFTKLGAIVEEYGSAYKTPLNSFQSFKRKCNLSVKDAAEKATWFSTELIDNPGLVYNATNGLYSCDTKMQKTLDEIEADPNPTSPIENPNIKWKPTLLISVYNSGIDDNGQIIKAMETANVIFNLTYSMDITFRGQRTLE